MEAQRLIILAEIYVITRHTNPVNRFSTGDERF